jgi:hypothetical protein
MPPNVKTGANRASRRRRIPPPTSRRRPVDSVPFRRPRGCIEVVRGTAGKKNVLITGADAARQALLAALVDEIIVHLAPVLLGAEPDSLITRASLSMADGASGTCTYDDIVTFTAAGWGITRRRILG